MDAFGEEAYFLGRHVDAQDSKNKQIIKEFIVSIYVHNWGFWIRLRCKSADD